MSHLADGTLRRIIDEPNAISDRDREHLATCAQCRRRGEAFANDARAVSALLEVTDYSGDATAALARVNARAPARAAFALPRVPRSPRWLAVAAAVVLVAVTLTTTGLADSFIQIFEPKQFVPVTVTSSDLHAIPDLAAYGTITWSGPGAAEWQSQAQALHTTDVSLARTKSGLPVLTPSSLPSSVDTSTRQFRVIDRARATFTFDATKARDAAAKAGKTPPPLPANIDGSSLAVDLGPVVLQLYKVNGTFGDLSGLAIIEARPPIVSSSGPSVKDFQDYLLAQPGISPSLAAQIRALGDPQSMLPVPVPVDFANARSVTVRGQQGLLLGDSTAIFSIVIWREGDVMRGVGGPLTDAQVLDVANSLR